MCYPTLPAHQLGALSKEFVTIKGVKKKNPNSFFFLFFVLRNIRRSEFFSLL